MGPEPTTPRYPRALVVTVATVQGHDFITCPQGAPRSEEVPMEPTANRGLARARHVLVEELEKVVLRIARRQRKQEDLAPPMWLDAEIETLGGVQAIELADASHADLDLGAPARAVPGGGGSGPTRCPRNGRARRGTAIGPTPKICWASASWRPFRAPRRLNARRGELKRRRARGRLALLR